MTCGEPSVAIILTRRWVGRTGPGRDALAGRGASRYPGDRTLRGEALGLPAEQYAIQTGTHPRETTRHNIDTFRRQIKSLGFSYDWDREVDTTDPHYYKWTQWIFLQIYDTWYDPDFEWTDPRGRRR